MKASFIALSTIAVLATAMFTSTPGTARPEGVVCTKAYEVAITTASSPKEGKRACIRKLRTRGKEHYGPAYWGLSNYSVNCQEKAPSQWRCVCAAKLCWHRTFPMKSKPIDESLKPFGGIEIRPFRRSGPGRIPSGRPDSPRPGRR